MYKKFSPEKSVLKNMYLDQRMHTKEIGIKFGLSYTTIRKLLVKHQIPIRSRSEALKGIHKSEQHRQNMSDAQIKFDISKEYLIEEYVNKKRNQKQIAFDFGTTQGTIRKNLRKYQIPIRSYSEINKSNWTEELKKKQSGLVKKRFENPSYRENFSKIQKVAQNKAELKKDRSNKYKEKWQDEKYRKEQIQKYKNCWSNDQKREEHSIILKTSYSKNPLFIQKISNTLKLKYKNKEYSDKITKINREINSRPEVLKKRSIASKLRMSRPEARLKMSVLSKERWSDPEKREEMIEKSRKANSLRPTSLENQFIELCKKHNLPFVYTGDGKLLINFKNPDFVDTEGRRLLIETANTVPFHHDPKFYEDDRIKRFDSRGFKTLVLWDTDFYEKPTNLKLHSDWEDRILKKVNRFMEQRGY